MRRWESPASGEPAGPGPDGHPRPGRALLLRSAAAPVLLAFATVGAVASAVLALLPAAFRHRPAGRLEARGGVAAAPEPTGEPLAR